MANTATLIRLELSKAIRRPMTIILAVILVGFMGFMYTVLAFTLFAADAEIEGMEGFDTAGLEQQLFLPDALSFGSSLVVGVGAVVMIIFGAGIFGSEFGWATIRMMLLMRAGRTQLVFAKLVLIVLVSTAVAVIGMGTVLVGSIGAQIAVGDASDVTGHLTMSLLGDGIIMTVRSIISITMWGLIGGMLALTFTSMAIGTGIALAGYFIGDLIISLIGQLGGIGEWFVRVMPTYGINAMVALNQVSPPDYSTAEIVGIIASLIIWAVVFVALGLYRFRNADVIAAST